MNLQDAFLNQARTKKIPVVIYLNSGYQLRGLIKGFDSFVIWLDATDKMNLVYKHAISTITPLKPITLFGERTAADNGDKVDDNAVVAQEDEADHDPSI